MNDLRYAFRQLLKNPGFTAVGSGVWIDGLVDEWIDGVHLH